MLTGTAISHSTLHVVSIYLCTSMYHVCLCFHLASYCFLDIRCVEAYFTAHLLSLTESDKRIHVIIIVIAAFYIPNYANTHLQFYNTVHMITISIALFFIKIQL